MLQHSLNTEGWQAIPFEAQGQMFLSKLAPNSPFLRQIANLPAGMFEAMNTQAVAELIGVGLTRAEIIEKIAEINEGASHAVVEIV